MDQNDALLWDGRRPRLLIVEDQTLIAMEMEHTLLHAGYEVIGIATDRDEAVSTANQDPPDIALVDIQLANHSSGLDVAADLNRRGICCLFVTGNCPKDHKQPHAIGCLHKPFAGRALVEAVSVAEQLMHGARPKQLPRSMHLY